MALGQSDGVCDVVTASDGMRARPELSESTRRVGIVGALGSAAVIFVYGVTLAIGLASLESADEPIEGPIFLALEFLILALAPLLIGVFASVHQGAPRNRRIWSLLAVVFAGLTAVVTSSVHFTILTVSRHPSFSGLEVADQLFSFRWPSIAYSLDVLAWDVFFALAVLCAAPVFGADRLGRLVRWLLVVSGVLSLAGLAGVPLGDMTVRNIGILGYAGVFPIALVLIGIWFHRGGSRGR